jgi:membrane protease YdiL (CAAX protease family)
VSHAPTSRSLSTTWLVYAGFVGLGLLARVVPGVFVMMVAVGLLLPVVAVRRQHPSATVGYTRRELGRSVLWGLGIGAVMTLLTLAVNGTQERPLPGVQLAIGVGLWFAVLSPFQENLFRGWIKPRLQERWGSWPGLLVASAAFAAGHLAPPLTSTPTSSLPLTTATGLGTHSCSACWRGSRGTGPAAWSGPGWGTRSPGSHWWRPGR